MNRESKANDQEVQEIKTRLEEFDHEQLVEFVVLTMYHLGLDDSKNEIPSRHHIIPGPVRDNYLRGYRSANKDKQPITG